MSIEGLKYYIQNPRMIIAGMGAKGMLNWMSDELYLKLKYKAVTGETLNLETPQTFNEKLQWLKLHDRKSLYTTLVDKYAVRQYISDNIGEEYLIPLLGVWDRFEDIDFDILPNQFVLKCTHDSGGNVICKDKSTLDIKWAQKKLNRTFRRNYFWNSREWPYKDVKPRIIAEKYMGDELTDYKFMCFNGNIRCLLTGTDRFTRNGLKVTYFDTDWQRLPFELKDPAASYEISKPSRFEEMIGIAQALSKGISFVRVDLYEIDKKIYFGEMTFFPCGGMGKFSPKEWDCTLGSWIRLPKTGVCL